MQLHLKPDGVVDACCTTSHPLGRIGEDSLADIWNGSEVRELRERLRVHDYRMGCVSCGLEVELEGRVGSIPAQYDRYEPEVGARASTWPKKIDFMLSNSCNLQCLQCSGEFSSAIRSKREGRPALVSPYGDEFFEDLRAFLPHLEEASFEGGEPFLSSLNYRVWNLVEELNPNLNCTVTTNATQLTPRVRMVMERLRMGVIISLDGATSETYERIRVGADFGRVFANTQTLIELAQSRGLPASINYCMMPSNYQDFEPLLRMADDLGVGVNVSVVRGPEHMSIYHLPQVRISEIVSHFHARDFACRSTLTINRDTWIRETERVRRWAEADELALNKARHFRIMTFDGWRLSDAADSARRVDCDEVRRRSTVRAAGEQVFEISVGYGDRILSCSPRIETMLGPEARRLVGQTIDQLRVLIEATYGSYEPELVRSEPDLLEYVAALGGVRAYCDVAANRDLRGELRSVSLFLSFTSVDDR